MPKSPPPATPRSDEVLPLAPDTMVDGLIAMMVQTPPEQKTET